jgi:phenylalanyl-tRNA synthetase beta subunit
VAIRAFDADRVALPLTIRPSAEGEGLEGRPGELPAGTLVIADADRPVALLFGATGSGRGVHPDTTRTLAVGVGVKGVPEIAVEEALWLVADAMDPGSGAG